MVQHVEDDHRRSLKGSIICCVSCDLCW